MEIDNIESWNRVIDLSNYRALERSAAEAVACKLICFDLLQPDFIMLEARNPHFHDLWILGRVQTPQKQHYLSLETPGHLTKS